MELFDVYPLYDVTPERAKGSYVYDHKGKKNTWTYMEVMV